VRVAGDRRRHPLPPAWRGGSYGPQRWGDRSAWAWPVSISNLSRFAPAEPRAAGCWCRGSSPRSANAQRPRLTPLHGGWSWAG